MQTPPQLVITQFFGLTNDQFYQQFILACIIHMNNLSSLELQADFGPFKSKPG